MNECHATGCRSYVIQFWHATHTGTNAAHVHAHARTLAYTHVYTHARTDARTVTPSARSVLVPTQNGMQQI